MPALRRRGVRGREGGDDVEGEPVPRQVPHLRKLRKEARPGIRLLGTGRGSRDAMGQHGFLYWNDSNCLNLLTFADHE